MRRRVRKACLQVLRQTFGVPGYRPGQKAAVSALLSGRDVLCILPTGAGKSLCWQLPAVMRQGLTVVVSPLIALMDDQVNSLHRRGIPAATLNSLMTHEERLQVEEQVRAGALRILLVSPERLETQQFLSLCRLRPPELLVVDEAHCVVQWGGEFRPPYSRIGGFVGQLPRRPVICAMTATADRDMQQEIAQSLGLRRYRRVMLPVMRENLHYTVRTTADRTREIMRIVRLSPVRTVIFCRTRQRTEQLAQTLRRAGFAAEYYHAGLDRDERLQAQARFRSGQTQCLAATTAFGMGVDIPDIRRVIHDSLPGNAIDLVQQSGRAGRDGQPADCVVLVGPEDLLRTGRIIRGIRAATKYAPLRRRRLLKEHWLPARTLLEALLTRRCITAALSSAFGQRRRRCGACSSCEEGPVLHRLPDLSGMKEESLRLWLLTWQRDAIAGQLGCPPDRIISRAALRRAARSLMLPTLGVPAAQQAMDRLMAAIIRAADVAGNNGGHSPSP